MTDAGGSSVAFGVETIDLDLPPLAAALSRRLHEHGVPVTPGRSVEFAHALTLVRPVSRRRLYWTARTVFVSDPVHVKAFDAVFVSIFGGRAVDDGAPLDEVRTVAAAPDDPPRSDHEARQDGDGSVEPDSRSSLSSSAASDAAEDAAEVEVPFALASGEELLRRKSFDALEPYELAQLYRLMSQLELATPPRRTRRFERGRHGERVDMRRTLRASLRTGGEPIRLAHRRRRIARRRLVMLCDISGSMEPYARAYLQFLTCAAAQWPEGRGVRVRHAAHPSHTRARVP